MKAICVLLALCVASFAFPQEHGHHGTSYAEIQRHDGKGHEVHIKAHPEYKYGWKIDDDTHHVYTQKKEERDGYKVKGEYSLVEPDGKTVRKVEYESDKKSGWKAKVTYQHHH